MDQDYVVKLSHRMDKKTEKHTATRTINLHEPDEVKKIKQKGTVTRTVTTDAVTGEKTCGDWSKAKWDEFRSPKVKGYTASKDKVAKKTVYGDSKNDTVDIYYKKSGASVQNGNSVSGQGSTPSTTSLTTGQASSASLPQTGNESSILMQSAGMFATSASLLATVAGRKKKSK